ncbi:MAG: hypothetical protein ABSH51_31480, partial [Solirubrobacteraceae bacterium]
MTGTTLDSLRGALDVESGPDVIAAITRASDVTIDSLAERLLASPSRPVRPATAHEVRPLVNARASLLSRGA